MEALEETPSPSSFEATKAKNSSSEAKIVKKIICRYGRGCTHIYDAVHRERFWHPPTPKLTEEDVKARHICNECGLPFNTLPSLRVHLIRKTAWSNQSLKGCRVSCLLDNREWHEGVVLKFEKGKHLVQFKTIDDKQFDKKWFNMSRIAFYIIDRPQTSNMEVKEIAAPESEVNLPTLEEEGLTFVEELTIEYAYAQSLLYKLYGHVVQETGHKTKGHLCLTDADKEYAKVAKGSLLYGELLPRGVNKALDSSHLRAHEAKSLFDLGMGTGKVALQAFVQFRNLRYVYGVELARGRYNVAEQALVQLSNMHPHTYQVRIIPGKSAILFEKAGDGGGVCETKCAESDVDTSDGEEDFANTRVLHFVCGNMMDTPNLHIADIVMLETDVPVDIQGELCRMLAHTKQGSYALTYLDLRRIWDGNTLPYRQLDINKQVTDRYPTSWSVQRGHHFYLWHNVKVKGNLNPSLGLLRQTDAGSGEEDRPNSCLAFGCVPRMFLRGYGFGNRKKKSADAPPSPDPVVPNLPLPDEVMEIESSPTVEKPPPVDPLLSVVSAALSSHPAYTPTVSASATQPEIVSAIPSQVRQSPTRTQSIRRAFTAEVAVAPEPELDQSKGEPAPFTTSLVLPVAVAIRQNSETQTQPRAHSNTISTAGQQRSGGARAPDSGVAEPRLCSVS